MANTIADKLERLEQTKQELYEALAQKGLPPSPNTAFSVYPSMLRSLMVVRDEKTIYGRGLSLSISDGSGGLSVANISTSGSNIVVALNGEGGYSGPGYGGSVKVSGEIVIPIL